MDKQVRISFRCSQEEADRLKKVAEDLCFSESAFIRYVLFDKEMARLPPAIEKLLAEYVYQLGKIGNNINQIAYRSNAQGYASLLEYDEVKKQLSKMYDLAETFRADCREVMLNSDH